MGHFLCCDRWGQPSQAELANGMPFHGEAAQVVWAAGEVSGTAASMSAALPMAGMTVARTVALTGPTSPGRSNHSDTTLYSPLHVIIYTKYTGRRQKDFNFYA
jgi:hypothetical protein